jgi:hypothetical protein
MEETHETVPELPEESREILECPNPRCRVRLSIPRSEDQVQVICPRCGTSFVHPPREERPSWFVRRVRAHPIFLGIVATLWSFMVLEPWINGTLEIPPGLVRSLGLFVFWVLGSLLLDLAREPSVRWYHRRWFVLIMLLILAPLGISLLWSGSKFRKGFRIALTVIASLWFLFGILAGRTDLFEYSPQTELVNLIRSPKGDIHVDRAPESVREDLGREIRTRSQSSTESLAVPEIARRSGESIVLVRSLGLRGNTLGLGSGFVVGRNGAIATNYHVVASAHDIEVEFVDGRTYIDVELIVSDADHDLAVLQVEGVLLDLVKGLPELPEADTAEFSPVVLGNSDLMRVGEHVVAIGNPYSWENTLSDGLISGIRDLEGIELLQITAPISPGSSGGALFNMRGEVVGITTVGSTWGAQNLNFAVPVNTLKSLIAAAGQGAS